MGWLASQADMLQKIGCLQSRRINDEESNVKSANGWKD